MILVILVISSLIVYEVLTGNLIKKPLTVFVQSRKKR